MRVTALGVNSAFAKGNYAEVLPITEVRSLISRTIAESRRRTDGELNVQALLDQIDRQRQTAYMPKWQSNFLLEFDRPGKASKDVFRLVIDCGGDIRHSLAAAGLSMNDIDAWYISHPHADHIGGIEGIALSTLFNPAYTPAKRELLGKTPITNYLCEHVTLPPEMKPDLMGHSSVLEETWEAANPGLRTIQGVEEVRLDTYFHPVLLKSNKNYTISDGEGTWTYYTIVTTHVVAGRDLMPSYGLMFENGETRIYFPTDTQLFMPPQVKYFYDRATVVYMDCETGYPSGVHPPLAELQKLEPELKRKMWLYHYDAEPVYDEGEFGGTLRAGMTHVFPAKFRAKSGV